MNKKTFLVGLGTGALVLGFIGYVVAGKTKKVEKEVTLKSVQTDTTDAANDTPTPETSH